MDSQVDSAQRRAEAEKVYGQLTAVCMREGYEDRESDIEALVQYAQQVRREALDEAAKVARDRALLWKSHGGAKMASPYGHLTVEGECEVIADAIDRLREGV